MPFQRYNGILEFAVWPLVTNSCKPACMYKHPGRINRNWPEREMLSVRCCGMGPVDSYTFNPVAEIEFCSSASCFYIVVFIVLIAIKLVTAVIVG